MRSFSAVHAVPLLAAGTGAAVIVGVLGATVVAPEFARAVVVATVLLLLTLPLIGFVTRKEPDHWLAGLLVIAIVARFAAAGAQYLISRFVYGGDDSVFYDQSGRIISRALVDGTDYVLRGVPGTGTVEYVLGVFYMAVGPTRLGGFFLFSVAGFWGCFFFLKAFRTALPSGNYRRYALLLMLLPSQMFWPSVINKDAIALLGLGIAAYGSARLLRHLPFSLIWLMAGLVTTGLVRPHISLLLVITLTATFVLAPGRGTGPVALARKLFGLAALCALSYLALGQLTSFFNLDGDGNVVSQSLELTQTRTEGVGGSAFDSVGGRSIADLPNAVVSVLFRPFVWEVRNPQQLIAAVEGVVLLSILAARRSQLGALIRNMRDQAYAVLCGVYVLLFCLAFSNIGNFGILAHQRIQLFPFLLVLVALLSPKPAGAATAQPSQRMARARRARVSRPLRDNAEAHA
jgi:hypothetical protein